MIKEPAIITTLTKLAKEKGEVTLGDPVSRLVGSTLGKANFTTLYSRALIDPQRFVDPYDDNTPTAVPITAKDPDKRARVYRKLLTKMQEGSNGELDDVAVRLGGPRFFSDLRRTIVNPRTTVLGKVLGVATHPISYITSNLGRSDHYNPLSHTAVIYSHNPAIATHELGHAIDMNPAGEVDYNMITGERSKASKEAPIRSALYREIKNIPSDAYRSMRVIRGGLGLPEGVDYPITLYVERNANVKSDKAIEKSFSPKAKDLIRDARSETLPAAYMTYASAPIGTLGAALAARYAHQKGYSAKGIGLAAMLGAVTAGLPFVIGGKVLGRSQKKTNKDISTIAEELDTELEDKKKK